MNRGSMNMLNAMDSILTDNTQVEYCRLVPVVSAVALGVDKGAPAADRAARMSTEGHGVPARGVSRLLAKRRMILLKSHPVLAQGLRRIEGGNWQPVR